jgi:hypothetical protein
VSATDLDAVLFRAREAARRMIAAGRRAGLDHQRCPDPRIEPRPSGLRPIVVAKAGMVALAKA